jgi:GT2 family glycosyltransferase
MLPKVSGSIVLFKSNFKQLLDTVNSFQNSWPEGELYLVDNSPRDLLRDHFEGKSRIHYIFNNRNLGFGTAHNIAIRLSQQNGCTYHLVLNPDVSFGDEVIPKVVSLMEEHPNVGLVMPKVLYPDGRIQHLAKLLPSPGILFFRRFFTSWRRLLDRNNHIYELKFSGYNRTMDVPYLSGCFMMLRNDCLMKIGLFDEDIFLYTEDIDLTRRIHAQFRTVFYPEVSIYHVHERGSYKKLIPFLLHVRSAVTYFNKWGWFNDPEREHINRLTLLRLTE